MPEKSKRTYKDTLFVDLFCEDKDGKKNFLDLYNALHSTQLELETTELRDVRIDGVLYTTLRNDVSMLVDGKIVVLCEQQSSINENMPLRCLMYIARIYEGLMDNTARFRRTLQKISAPEFYVFYNGTDDMPVQQELHLREAFMADEKDKDFPLDLCVMVYNINKSTGKALWEKCKTLTEYNTFVSMVREELTHTQDGFMARAIRRALKAGILAGYLDRKSKEVENMFFGEYDYATDIAVQREEAQAVGIAIGEERGRKSGIAEGSRAAKLEAARAMIADGMTAEQAAKYVGLTVTEVQALAHEQI